MSPKRATLGSVLRALRARFGWTLKEMSQRSGIPVSTLSKVEHDRLTLTYDKLQQISERLKIQMSDLFATNGGQEPAVMGRRSISRSADALRIETENYDHYYLNTDLRRKLMIPIIAKIRKRDVDQFGALTRHHGEEIVYVLEGSIAVHTEYYDTVTLNTGDSIYLDSSMGHAYLLADGCEEATVLSVCASVEDGLMEALQSLHAD